MSFNKIDKEITTESVKKQERRVDYAVQITIVKKKGLLKHRLYWAKAQDGNLLNSQIVCLAENLKEISKKIVILHYCGYEQRRDVLLNNVMEIFTEEEKSKAVGLSLKPVRKTKTQEMFNCPDTYAVEATLYRMAEGKSKPPIAEDASVANNDLKTIER